MVAVTPLPIERLLLRRDWSIADFAAALTPPVARDIAKCWVRGQMPVPPAYREQVDVLLADPSGDPTVALDGIYRQYVDVELEARRDLERRADGQTDVLSEGLNRQFIRLARGTRAAFYADAHGGNEATA